MSTEIRSAVIRSLALLVVKIAAFLATGSAVLLAGMIDSLVDVVASLIAYVIKPREHHEEHQLAMIQAFWIVSGGLIVMVESVHGFNEEVDLAMVGIGILLLTLVVDGTIVRKLSKNTSPVVHGLAEDIKADMTNSFGGLVALTAIAMGAPMQVDKIIAIIISIALIIKGAKLAHDNLVEASQDHASEHKPGEGGVASELDYAR
jgi:ferrous-iron efflux pump FieF